MAATGDLDCPRAADHHRHAHVRHHLRADRGWSRNVDDDNLVVGSHDLLQVFGFWPGQHLLDHYRAGHTRARVCVLQGAVRQGRLPPVTNTRGASRGAFVLLCAGLLGLFLLAPFYWVIVTSFMPEYEVISVPPHWLPEAPTLENFAYFGEVAIGQAPTTLQGGLSVVSSGPSVASNSRAQVAHEVAALPQAMLNSVLISLLVVAANLVVGLPAAYSFVRLRFRGSTALLMLYLTSRMLPSVALMIPIYVFFAGLGLINTIVAPTIADITVTLPFTIWILKSSLQTSPQEL